MSKLKLPKEHPHFNGRTCTTCGEFKTSDQYSVEKDSRSLTGVSMRSKCKPCNEFRKYKSAIKRLYGITYEEYKKILEEQSFCCAICKEGHSNSVRTSGKLFVDHCHSTGKVRGLLCSRCNHALGQFDDDKTKLTNAIEYLERN